VTAPTLGVEEEYLLLEKGSGLPLPRARTVRTAAGLDGAVTPDEVQPELLQAQIEVNTPVCHTLDEVHDHLLRLRSAVAGAAEQAGCLAAGAGAAPFAPPAPAPVTDTPRYRSLRTDARQLVDEQLINGMHVHVGVPDRERGVAALNRVQPWLPVLVAMAANSPLWRGADTGFASWRTVVFGRWPVSGPPPAFRDAADFDARVRGLLDAGVIRDAHQAYWQARPSDHYPTLEVRAMDVQLDVEDAVLLAGTVRALVATALREAEQGSPFTPWPHELATAAHWHAARYGTTDTLVCPRTARPRPAADVIDALLDHVGAALDEAGDTDRVASLAHRLLDRGTGADRQREALRAHGAPGLLDLLGVTARD
jgi:carboxylate-amine ligase